MEQKHIETELPQGCQWLQFLQLRSLLKLKSDEAGSLRADPTKTCTKWEEPRYPVELSNWFKSTTKCKYDNQWGDADGPVQVEWDDGLVEFLHFAHRYGAKRWQKRVEEKYSEQDVPKLLANIRLSIWGLCLSTNHNNQNTANCEGYHEDFELLDCLFKNDEG